MDYRYDFGWSMYQEIDLKTRVVESGGPLVSVIIPCYNQAQYLPEAVESVLAQEYSHWEIIIVNDGSQDTTNEVARGLARAKPDRRIRLLEQANGGLAEARNAGIRASAGQYILPLDADDKIAPAMLEKTLRCLEGNPGVGIVYTDAEYFGSVNRMEATADFDFTLLCFQNHLNYCSLFRREVWQRAGGYNRNLVWGYEDWDFWISCAEQGCKARRIPEPLFQYRVKPQSMYTAALEHDLELRAQIVMNHPALYDEPTQSWARAIFENALTPAISALPEPHAILSRARSFADWRRRNGPAPAQLQALNRIGERPARFWRKCFRALRFSGNWL
jgi:glycosyltransferase involved in cell wall biosynthesis